MKTFTSAHIRKAEARTAAFCVILSKGIGRIEQKEVFENRSSFLKALPARAGIKNQPERDRSFFRNGF